jgi:hypothetical protein
MNEEVEDEKHNEDGSNGGHEQQSLHEQFPIFARHLYSRQIHTH